MDIHRQILRYVTAIDTNSASFVYSLTKGPVPNRPIRTKKTMKDSSIM